MSAVHSEGPRPKMTEVRAVPVAKPARARWPVSPWLLVGLTLGPIVVTVVAALLWHWVSARLKTPPPDPTPITAEELSRAYRSDNELAADQRYKGRWLMVSGAVHDVKRDAFGEVVVTLKTGSFLNSLSGIRCAMDAGDEHALAALWEGDQVKIVGRFGGQGAMGGLTLQHCRLAK